MKSPIKKLFALLLAVIMILSVIPLTVFGLSNTDTSKQAENAEVNRVTGHIPSPRIGGRALTEAYLKGEGSGTRDPLPTSYDSRDYGYITSVKNQNPWGTCWAHGALASVEAYMIQHGITDKDTGAPANRNINLSEYHLAWFNYTNAYDKLGMLTGDSSTPVGDNYLNLGANGMMATYTLMRGEGPASENTAALRYSAASTSGLNSQYAYDYNVATVTDVTWIPCSNRDAVKAALMEHGAATISYHHNDSYYNSTTAAFCFKQNVEYGSDNYQWANHDVTLVGWDDNYSRTNFKSTNRPSSNGAWIIKNSWGTSWGSNGYFYLSYEDTASADDYCYFYTVAPAYNYENIYQYDGTCNLISYQSMNNNCQVANIFTANGSEQLKAVALAVGDEATTYTLNIYKNPTSASNPTSGTLACTQNGSIDYTGYYTIPLNNPVSLNAGDKFAVVFTLSTTAPSWDNMSVHMPYDATSNEMSWCTWVHANHGNTSYYKEANGSWRDVPNNGDFRIKAYTDSASNYTVTAVSNNNSYGTVAVDGNRITATPANGYYVESAQVISGTATFTINGNVITVEPSSNCTIRVNFARKQLLTVNYIVCGEPSGSVTAYNNDSINLPTSVNTNPSGWTFIGWCEEAINETTVAPTYYAPGAAYVVNGNTNLFALYSRTEGTGGVAYEIVNVPVTDWSGRYVITSGKDTNLIALKTTYTDQRIENATCGASVAYANTGMTLDGTTLRNVPADYVFEIAPRGSSYTIKSPASGYYIGVKSGYLHNMASYETSNSDWNLEYDTYNICIKAANVGSTTYPYLVTSASNHYFVVNTSHTTTKTQFWKETAVGTTYYYTNPCTNDGGDDSDGHPHELYYYEYLAPTCTEDGYYAHYYCFECDKYYSDANGENELDHYSVWIFSSGEHHFENPISNNNGTHTGVCSGCGETETVPCTYHDVVTPPYNGNPGYTTHTCTVCGYSYVDNYVYDDPDDGPTYTLVNAIENGGKYIIVAANSVSGSTGYAVGNTTVSNNRYLSTVKVTINGNTLDLGSANADAITWTASGNASSGYTFRNVGNSKYMGLDSAQYLYPSNTGVAWKYTSAGALDNQIDTDGYYYLSYTSGRYTTSKTAGAVRLYKVTSGGANPTPTPTPTPTPGPTTYTVTFRDWDGTVLKTQYVTYGGSATAPANPSRPGYTFIGWDRSFSYITANTVVTAMYQQNSAPTPTPTPTPAPTITYQLATSIVPGYKYVLVSEKSVSGTTGYAVGNTTVSNNRYLTPVRITVNSNGTLTLPAGTNANAITWIAGGNATSGYTFLNAGNNRYMGLDSAQYLFPSTTPVAWRYVNGALDNQIDTDGYFYLSYASGKYTTSKTASTVRLYRVVEG